MRNFLTTLLAFIAIIQFCVIFYLYNAYYDPINTQRYSQFKVPVDLPASLSSFDQHSTKVLYRYLAGNPQWDVREKDGQLVAIRLDVHDIEKGKPVMDGLVPTTWGGYSYSENGIRSRTSKVRIIFGAEVNIGKIFERSVTRAPAGSENVDLWTYEMGYEQFPTLYSSHLIAQGDHFNIEIMDETPDIDRTYTKKMLREIDKELQGVLHNQNEIKQAGSIADLAFYPYGFATESSVAIHEYYHHPGRYQIKAQLNLKSEGVIETRLFNADTNEQLSKASHQSESHRHVGWSKNGGRYFEYNSIFDLPYGKPYVKYNTRFEIWQLTSDGEYKLAEKDYILTGDPIDWDIGLSNLWALVPIGLRPTN